ncbi:MAG: TonB-dependent receptor, partial [Puia sp.]
MRNFIFSFCLLLFVNYTCAQQIISGRIMDGQTGEPLSGASVRIENTSLITSSGKSGEFLLRSPQTIDSLTVSFIGYKTRHLDVNSNTPFMNIEMETGMASLNNVTVTGYENNRKLLETAGSIAIITSREIQRGNNLSILPLLNTVPGVKMEEAAPGNYKISLRGSALRDPYGLRNLKLYWNDIPLTSPDNSASHT